jgi:uncharacterized membrane protein
VCRVDEKINGVYYRKNFDKCYTCFVIWMQLYTLLSYIVVLFSELSSSCHV